MVRVLHGRHIYPCQYSFDAHAYPVCHCESASGGWQSRRHSKGSPRAAVHTSTRLPQMPDGIFAMTDGGKWVRVRTLTCHSANGDRCVAASCGGGGSEGIWPEYVGNRQAACRLPGVPKKAGWLGFSLSTTKPKQFRQRGLSSLSTGMCFPLASSIVIKTASDPWLSSGP